MIPVILSGGSGSRLWPLSREAHPKPFVQLPDDTTLMGRTYERAAALDGVSEIFTVANENHYFLAADSISACAMGSIKNTYLLEPIGRNTAPAIAAAALEISRVHGQDTVMLVLPADHLISNVSAFSDAAQEAERMATLGNIVTFGICPTRPETGYGYIEVDEGQFIGFVEKPDQATANEYMTTGRHFWNSGMFCFTAATIIDAMKSHCPQLLALVEECLAKSKRNLADLGETVRLDRHIFPQVENISIDYAVMEKAPNIACIATRFDWSDIGSWVAFSELFHIDEHDNRTAGDVISINASKCIVDAETRLVGLVGVQDLIVVDTADALLIAAKEHAQEVRRVFDQLRASDHQAAILHRTVHRPWGTFTVLEEGDRFKIKRVEVKPGHRLSLQAHHHRSEHWVIVSGTARVINGNEETLLSTDQSTYIPCGIKHSLENPGLMPLVLIEVQTGEYLGEDDIVRFDDIYGRV